MNEKTRITNVQVETRRNPGKWAQGVMKAGMIGSTVALGGIVKEGYDYNKQFEQTQVSAEEIGDDKGQIDDAEMIAEELPSPVGEKVIAARKKEAELGRNQTVFIRLNGIQITEAFTLSDAAGYSVDEMTWRYQGAGPVGIPPEWINEQKKYISSELGIPISEIQMLHAYQDLSSTRAEHMNSRVELVYKNATTSLESDPQGRDALSIIRLETNFTQLPPRVEEEFTPYLIGIAAEESRFDANKTSKSGAIGLLQTMPSTFEGYKEKYNLPHLDPRNLSDQLPVGIEHIETSYAELEEKLEIELSHVTHVYFNGNRASMEKYFLIPLMINSYNSGQDRMIEVVRWFFANYPNGESTAALLGKDEPLTGYDIFFAMTYQCAKEKAVDRFGPESSTYVSKVMGWTPAFLEYEKKQQELEMASN